jgi:hypothetical protein
MTLNELQNIVLILANHSHTRYWKHWNYPNKEPWLMAINTTADKVEESGFLSRGFIKRDMEGVEYWIIERTSEDGSPWDAGLY